MEDSVFTLEGRVMCSDDACIGTVGSDGKCKVCERVYEGGESLEPSTSESPLHDDPTPSESSQEGSLEISNESAPTDPDERVCCPDEACIGIIGADGKCGTCGSSS